MVELATIGRVISSTALRWEEESPSVKSKTDVFLGKWILDREELWIIAGQESEMMDDGI